MNEFKKATVVSAAVAIFAAGAYVGLQGLKSVIAEQFAASLAVREAATTNFPGGATEK